MVKNYTVNLFMMLTFNCAIVDGGLLLLEVISFSGYQRYLLFFVSRIFSYGFADFDTQRYPKYFSESH